MLVSSLAGADGFAAFVLLAAIVAGAVQLVERVGEAAEHRSSRFPVVMAGAGLVWLVAAGAAHVPLLVLGLLACAGFELLGDAAALPDAVVEPVDLVDAPVSRAA